MKNNLSNKFILSIHILFFCVITQVVAQKNNFVVKGNITDAQTKEPIIFATVIVPGTNIGTRSDIEGNYTLSANVNFATIRFGSLGYKEVNISVTPTAEASILNITLEPASKELTEVVIKQKKYKNKDNPAVALIEHVIENRDKNRIENFTTFEVKQYEKIMMALTSVPDKLTNKKMFKSWQYVFDNTDTTKIEGQQVLPAYLQENIQTYYSKTNPKKHKTIVEATKSVQFPFLDEDGIDTYIALLYQEVDIYENFVRILNNDFLSPIANNAPLFYRYYPADTIEVQGSKVVRLQFYPRNKMDLLLEGDIYVALDSTYPVTNITFSVNPNINLNWVREMHIEQKFEKQPLSGKWVIEQERHNFDFGLGQKGMGVYGERYVSNREHRIDSPIPEHIFGVQTANTHYLEGAKNKDTTFWASQRHVPLSKAETLTYSNMDSLVKSPLFNRITNTLALVFGGYWKPIKGFDIGKVNSFYSFNAVEGDRFRFGGRTNPDFSTRAFVEGYAAYGLRDRKWKYGVAMTFSANKNQPYNQFPYTVVRLNYTSDLMVPGVVPNANFASNNIFTSFTRGKNDRFLFQKKFMLEHEKEFRNHFSYTIGFTRNELGPLGSLHYFPSSGGQPEVMSPVVTFKPYIQLRYAPGEKFYERKNGWRRRIQYNYIIEAQYARGVQGWFGGQYDFDEYTLILDKFTRISPLGTNKLRVDFGAIVGNVPYPIMSVHRANQTFLYQFEFFNMMNFMEFVSDRYISVATEQSFYGFFLNKVPLLKRLKLREYASFKALYGFVSKQNQPANNPDVFRFPTYPDGSPLTYTLEKKPYMEASIGIGNIFKVLRIDLVQRLSYLEHPQTSRWGVRAKFDFQF